MRRNLARQHELPRWDLMCRHRTAFPQTFARISAISSDMRQLPLRIRWDACENAGVGTGMDQLVNSQIGCCSLVEAGMVGRERCSRVRLRWLGIASPRRRLLRWVLQAWASMPVSYRVATLCAVAEWT